MPRREAAGAIEDAYPMSALQVGMVYEMERDPERLPYHNVHTLRIPERFDERRFRRAVAGVVARHPILRTSFALVGFSEPMQLVYDVAEVPVTVVDLRAADENTVRATLTSYLDTERRTPLDVTAAPLCRMGVHVLAGDAFQWTVTEHHAILDGWSLASLVAEITDGYRRLLAGRQPLVAPLRSTYRDFIAAEREARDAPESREFWQDLLDERPDSRLPRWPADRPVMPAADPVAGERHRPGSLISPLPADLVPRLRDLARTCRVPLKSVLLAAHMKVMSLVTGSADVVAGLTANGRLEEEGGADVCGLFVNTVPFRLELPVGSWRDLIGAVFDAESALLPHQRYPMAALQRELGGSQLFETNFVYTDFQQIPVAAADGGDDLTDVSRTHFALVVAVGRDPATGGLSLEMEYDARAFPAVQIAVLRDHYVRVMTAMAADPTAGHRWVPLLGGGERALLESWNSRTADVPADPVHRLVERRAAEAPDAVALVTETGSLTYGELNARANRMARRLRDLGVGPDTAVGVAVRRSVAMVTSWLAVLKAGGMYVPLDPDLPADRLRFMLTRARVPLVLTAGDAVPEGPWQQLVAGEQLWADGDADDLPGGAGPDHGCYVIFTSGSTGQPKGVVTRHRNVSELMHAGDAMTVPAGDTLLQIAPASFDVSTFEVWAPLAGGGRLALPPAVRFGPQEIAAWVARFDVTVLHATASLFALLVDHEPGMFDGLRRLLTGSETVSPGHVTRILDRCPDLEVVNCWGPTETTTFSVCGVYRRGSVPAGALPLGLPLVNTQVWVLDEAGLPVPVGSAGELYVSGPCLARGYLGPAMTAERFVPHPYRAGERLYRTGDRGRWSVDGLVEFLGRTDHMVKVRGYRVELGEVEAALRGHPDVRECVVVAARGDLVAYLVADGGGLSSGEARSWLGARLPAYMVPRLFVFLDALPLTPRAKVDRRALPDPESVRPEAAQEYVAPEGPVEELLAEIWCRVLGVDRVGRHDNFFDLGGDSIRSIQVLGLVREAGLTAGMAALLADPTPAGFAAALAQSTAGPRSEAFSLVTEDDRKLLPDGLADAYPMSELQAGMVYEMERDPGRSPYHNVHTMRLTGSFDEACFREALARVTARHPVLRTSFAMSRFSEPLQLVHPAAEIPFTVRDLRGEPAERQRAVIDEHLREQRGTPLDLTEAPLCRMAVHLLSDTTFQWTVTEHHAVLDGWSLTSMLSEITSLHEELLAGRDPGAAPLRSLYRDFIAAEREALRSPATRDYWRDHLAGSDGSPLPRWSVTGHGTLGETLPGERHDRDEALGHGSLVTPLGDDLRADIEEFARRAGVPFKTAVLAAHLRVVAAVTGGRDVTIGLSSHGRLEEADGAEVCGLFLNTLPFRVTLPDGSWRDLAGAVLDAEHEVMPHRRYPMAALQRELGRASLFEAGFVYNDFHRFGDLADGTGGWRIDAAGQGPSGSSRTSLPLLVSVSREAGASGLRLELEYDTRKLTADQVTLLRDYHVRCLRAMTAGPSSRHTTFALASGREAGQVAAWSLPASPVPSATTVHELVAAATRARPDAVALTGGETSLTYRELDERSDRLARRLRRLGVGPEVCVGVCLDRSWETVVACLAVVRAGGVYVPLDTAFPAERMEFMLRDVAAPLVVVHAATASRVPGGPWALVDLAGDTDPGDAVLPAVDPDSGCYVIFTSGSTGRPKGTTVSHRNVVRLIRGVREHLPFGPGDVWSLFHSFAFDFSVWELWGALTSGGRVVVVPYAVSRDADAFHQLVRDERVTVLSQTPSAFRQFETVDERAGGDLALRVVVFGGEALHRPSVRRWASRHGYTSPLLVNMYGITETTVHVTYLELDAGHVEGTVSRIGRPLPDLGAHVLDRDGVPSPVGVTGELYISGAGLARGYVGRPALTAGRFVPDHLSGTPGARLYRSGDLARWNAQGSLEYLGRADTQVKIRGYRIETGEIENALATHPRLLEAAVVPHADPEGRTELVAYLVPDPAGTGAPTADELRAWLGRGLPDYMIPRHFVALAALPLTPQGKVDRRALPEPGTDRPSLEQRYVPPSGDVEETLAGIWRQVLGVDRVGRHDNFFALGGDSIRSIQIVGRARDAGLTLELQQVLDAPTLAEQASVLDLTIRPEVPATQPFSLVAPEDRALLPAGLADAYPMAQLQVGMVFEMERDRARNPYHNVETLRLAGRFDEACFREAVDRVVARHPVLRTSFDLAGFGEPMQLVHSAVEVPFTVVDLRGGSAGPLGEYVREQQHARFDLSVAPLFRMAVHVLSDQAFQWTITEHHAILDGWSMVSTISEITDLYRRLLAGDQPPAEPLRSLYRDFVAAERAAAGSPEIAEFWRDRLADAPAGRMPRWSGGPALVVRPQERHDRDEAAGHGALTTPISAELLAALEEFARRAAVPLKTVVLAAHLKVIGLVTGSTDVLIGTTVNGRLEEPDGAEARGLFLNTVPLRVRLSEGSWLDLVRGVLRAERDLLPRRRYPMALLQREFGRDTPLVETNFTYNNFHRIARLTVDGTLDRDPAEVQPGVARTNFPLDVTVSHDLDAGGLLLEIGYSLRDLTDGQVGQVRDLHLRVLDAMVRAGETHHRASVLLDPEQTRLLTAWRGTDAPAAAAPVHELLRERAQWWPDAVAVESGGERLTFGGLDARSEALARRLAAGGVRRGDVVGLHLRPGVDAVVAVWAVWKAGGAFLPLDPDLPAARLAAMVEDAAPVVVVSREPCVWPSLPPDGDGDAVLPRVGARDLAYVMFTSGSTGRPKGVMVEHGGLANFAECLLLPRLRSGGVGTGANVRVLTGSSAFISDFFLEQILPLLDGHRLVVVSGAEGRDPRQLVAWAQDPELAVEVIGATTSQVQVMVEAGLLDAPYPPRVIAIGGEVCPPDLWQALRSRTGVRAHNTYGPAETAVDATMADIGAHESPLIGRPYGNVRVYLVDEGLDLVPPGSVGEIVVGGPGVGRGYVRRPGLTAGVFVPDPFGGAGCRLYRTGDLGRYTVDGQIEFLGRRDLQVKVLGQRVELEEVEAVLRGHPAVVAAAVSVHRRQLVGHVVVAGGVVPDREYLAARLPAVAVPVVVVAVAALPMTAGGKLDRRALVEPQELSRREVVAPRTETEQRIAAVWQSLLGVERVGVHDDFFALGGHSLLAIRLTMRVSAELGAEVALHEVFARPTVAAQAELVDRHGGGVERIPRVERAGIASHAQERQWFLWQLAPDNPAYNVPWGYEVRGELDLGVLGSAVDTLFERHESLRTTLHLDADGRVVPMVGAAEPGAMSFSRAGDVELPGLVERAARQPFDLTTGPMLRVNVWRTAADRHVVLFVAHHVAVDEWSIGILERELWALYRGAVLPSPAVRYGDYAAWHRDLVAGRADDDLAYWREALDGATSSWPQPSAGSGSADECARLIPADRLSGLDRIRGQAGATEFMLYLAVYCLLIARRSGDRDVTVGVPVSGRSHPDLAPVVGFFVNTLAVRVTVDPAEDFLTYLRRVRSVVLAAFAHQETPFEHVVRAVAPDRADGVNPLFRTLFSFTPDAGSGDGPAEPGADGLTLGDLPIASGGNHFDLLLGTARTTEGLHLNLEFSTAILGPEEAEDLLGTFADLLAAAGGPVSELLAANGPERERIAGWTGDAAVPAFDVPVHELLRERARWWPDLVAVESDAESLTFAGLDARSEAFARRLAAGGVRRGDVVGLHLRPGVDALVAVWAVWKAGGAFLPLDPDLPPMRLAAMVEDAAPVVVVSREPCPWPALPPDGDGDAVLPAVGARDLASVMFTSGSTGRPKGVMLDHGGLANFAERLLLPRLRRAGVGEHARVVTGTSAFISDFFLEQTLPLLGGHRLLVLSGLEGRDPRHLVERAHDRERAVDVICATTSQVQVMVEAGLLDAPYPPRLLEPAGEAVPPDLWRALQSRPGVAAHNIYGPAETTVDTTCADIAAHASPVLGRPYGNARVYLVDEGLDLVPPGSVGEIVVGGPGVGRGYVRRPGLTAGVFVPDPFGGAGCRLYRTGDLGRYTVDGQIEFLGRRDLQVKVLGQRVELEEVEAVLRGHPAVVAAAVSVHRRQLVGHVVVAGGVVPDREYLAARLPAVAVPVVVVAVAALPMTAGGKLDRRALVEPQELSRREVVAPRTETERRVAEVWQSLLGVERVGVHDDFFALGGHSLLAIRLTMRVSAELGAEVALHEVFARPTVAAQAELVDRHGGGVERIPRVGRAGIASHAQERQWFLWQLAPDNPAYNVPWGYEIHGELDVAALGTAVDALIARHEALRTTLHLDADGRVVQRIGLAGRTDLTVRDAAETELPGLVERAARQPFDLTTGPMLRVNVWRTAADRHVVLFVAHHVAVDEWSMGIFEREMWELYGMGGAAELPPLEVTYADYAAWHRDQVAGRADRDLAFWRRTLEDVPTSAWPHRTSDRGAAPGERSRLVPADRLTALDQARREAGATEFMAYLAAYSLLIARSSGERDITVGVPVSGRSHPDLAPVVGFFVNTLAVRLTVHPADDFLAHLRRVRSVVLAALAHQETPFEHVVRAVAPDRADGVNPLFRTMFAFTPAVSRPATGLAVRDLPIESRDSHFDLSLSATRTTEGLYLTVEFGAGIFAAGEAEGLLGSFADLLAAVGGEGSHGEAGRLAHPDRGARGRGPVSELLAASGPERERIAAWTGDAAAPAFDVPVHELLRERAGRWAQAVAVESGGEMVTFAGLDARSEALARCLVVAGVHRGDVVGLHLRPGVDAVVAVWAVWKAGGAFLPLDPDLPAARLAAMVEDAEPVVVVSREPCAWPSLPPDGDADAVLPRVGARDLAYVMFTSGSTGRPKGVMVEHGGLANFAERMLLPRIGSPARVLTGSSAFISDFFLAQILPLLGGHRLVVVSGAEGRDPRQLVAWAQDPELAVQVIDATTSQVQVMVEAGLLDAPYPPRLIAIGGEACPPDLWQALRSRPGLTAYNTYGPAETTVEVAVADIAAHASPVLGRPYGNARVYLVDEGLDLVPPGSVGEIVVGGPGVGRGYVRRPGLTAGVFVPDPFGGAGCRLYRTGDLGRYTVDGQIEFLGRRDLQVKVLGQRVELEEVEAVLRGHPAVVAAAVSVHRRQLVGHVVVAGGVVPDREYLAARLPAVAVPVVVVAVAALPMTAGGKLDRRALVEPQELSRREVVAPRTETEQRIAAVWQSLLGVERVGVHDDFFALGGHSLLAIRLTMQLSSEFGTEIPLAHLYTAPTVADQAERIATLPSGRSAVVPLGGVRGARPLVLVHPIGGTLFSYRDLLAEVRGDVEAYGLQGHLGADSGATDIAQLARRYADELAPVLGDREPVVAGWSAGGILAHEVARALAGRGVRTYRLVLIDTDPRPDADADAAAQRADIATLDQLRREVAEHGPAPLLRSADTDRLFAALGIDPAAVAELDGPTTAALIAFWRDMLTGLAAHRPGVFAGPAELVLGRGEGRDRMAAAWRGLTGTLTVSHADGDHFQLLRRPWVTAIADAVRGSTAQTGE
ncbi:amino acid adenylation domain-containing protein [Paractinoplanes brasiliensis]|uniref:Amino acid adenylation domain-containing protein n=7 Tax=Paractinoplanes brasiliensis TaxID=52695 RepID=A0A4R6JQ75_9ACTN|nr:amino acid adenylation domain-containing protein [Actinoplanes brasiliensis]